MLQKLEPRIPDICMAVPWNPGGQTVILKINTTISYVRESHFMARSPPRPTRNIREKMTEIQSSTPGFDTVREVTEYHMKNYHQCKKNQPACSIIIFTHLQK